MTTAPNPRRRDVVISLVACALVVATIFAVRWLGPGDLY
jgi:hypothetical protein